MALYSQKLSKPKYHNWVKATLAVLLTKEVIEPFVYTELHEFQLKCLDDICYDNGLISGVTCSSCCTENVVTCPTYKICNVKQGNCSFHRDAATQYNSGGCTSMICHYFKNKIQQSHCYNGPSYKNTDATQWCSNPWEVAKCFMPPDGYKDVTNPAETDFNGINSIIINYKGFSAKIKDRNVFEKARVIGSNVRHSPDLEIDATDLQQYFTDLNTLLSDPGYLANDIKAQEAQQQLLQLQNDTLPLGEVHIKKVLDELDEVIKENMKKELNENLKLLEESKKAIEKLLQDKEKHVFSQIDIKLTEALEKLDTEASNKLAMVKQEMQTSGDEQVKRIAQALDEKDEKIMNVPDDFVYDSYALDLYTKALQEGTEEDRSIRVNIVGNFGQGKTSLVRRLVGESIEGVYSTNGIAVDRYEYKREKDGTFSYVRKTTLDNSDMGNRLALVARASTMEQGDKYGNDNLEQGDRYGNYNLEQGDKYGYDNLEPLDYDNAESAEVQENIQDTVIYHRNTEQEDLYESVNSHPVQCTSQSHEKRRKRQRLSEVDLKIFKECLQSNNNSANDNNIPVSFDIWDFGGQHTFYATHTIFHSRRAIYLLVFNLSLNLKEQAGNKGESEDCFLPPRNRDMAYYIRFWMNSINSFVGNEDGSEPPVILVGTHKDKLSGNEEERTRQADNYFCDVRDLFEEQQIKKHIRPADYAIDNTNRSDESIQSLRDALIQLGEEKSKTVSIPAKWIQLEKSVLEKRADRIISLTMVIKMDLENEFPLDSIEEIKLFLKYHHNKGTVCYFDEEPLSDHVIVDPQYLIDSFKCIITSRIFCKKDPELTDFWTKLFNEAKLEHFLIDRVWGRDTENEFSKNKSILIAFLKKHHIISEVMIYDSTKEKRKEGEWFLVPSLLRNHSSETNEIDDYLRGKQQSLSRYVLKFENSAVVATIYHRVVAASLGNWAVAQYRATSLIYENLLALQLNLYNVGLIEMKNNHIDLTVVSLCQSIPVEAVIADTLRRFVESVVDYEFGKLRDAAGKLRKPYMTKLRCNHPEHCFTGSIKLMEILKPQKRNKLPCPDSMSHEINIKMTWSEWFQDGKSLQDIPRQQLSEKCLSKISPAIGENWKLLGIELDLTEVEIQHIVIDNQGSVVMSIYKMLLRWKEKAADTATMDDLVKAMRKCPDVYVDWDIIRNVIDEIISTDASGKR